MYVYQYMYCNKQPKIFFYFLFYKMLGITYPRTKKEEKLQTYGWSLRLIKGCQNASMLATHVWEL